MVQLPIDPLKSLFIEKLAQHHLVVEAETGSGKSTRLPLWAAESGKVLVIEPRRIACSSLAEFLAAEKGETIGKSIGYAIRFEAHFDENTDIIFATPGVALRWLSEGQLTKFKTIIIDEFHERRWDTDLLLALLKDSSSNTSNSSQKQRLVITSATIDSQRLTQYLGAEHLKAEGRNFPVTVEHIAVDNRHSPDIRSIENKVFGTIQTYLNNQQALGQNQGDILVFLPGRKEIAQCQSKLKPLSLNFGIDVIPLHASVSDTDRQRALTASEHQRVILATNVAETSLTIPGVTLIIDTGLERRTHQRNGRTVLGLHAISRASAEQRKGRAGRISAGHCIRLYGSAAPLELITPPELHREELTEPMLAAACCDHRLTDLVFIDTLPEKALTQAQERLTSMQAIDDNGLITEHGKHLYPLPIDALFAHLITAMPNKAATEAMVDLAAALSVSNKLWQKTNNEEVIEQLEQWEKHHCDGMLLIKLLREPTPDFLTVDADRLQEARQISAQIREALSLPQLDVATSVKRDAWLAAVIKAAPELAFVRREKRRQALGNGYCEVTLGRDSRLSDKAEAAVVFDQFSLPGKGVKQTLNLATCTSPIPLSMLVDLELGEQYHHESKIIDGQCISTTQRIYSGRVIDEQTQSVSDLVTTAMIVEMIQNNQIFPGLATEREHQIEQWNLFLKLGLADPTLCTRNNPTDLNLWLNEQIEALGVDSLDDLALFNNDDFIFDGIPEWEQAEFDERFPRKIYIADLHLSAEYAAAGKLVTVVYQSGSRKQDPQRWELPRWQGWRIKYRKASRIIDIR
ncbi:helicase-related protein [Photobacterium sanguinicancri]|uniref:Helicase-related protein n=1 Tax=Photobacterium sanguinicancri TaxID=875932 RepID=A0AAW7Y3C3_9GAMM|nr:helicase-related protein [Photobacterium sanguinicancri]MDO6542889.1 helicase-related protein [Photobacterium sanguinicancri]